MSKYYKGILLVIITALISGFSIFLNKYGVNNIDATLFTGLKNIFVGSLFVLLILVNRDWASIKNITKQQWKKLILVGIFGGSIPFVLFFQGLKLTGSLQASFIHKTLFLYVAILGIFFLKEKLSTRSIVSLVIMILGLILFLKIKLFNFSYGDWLILLATLFWSVEIIISKKLLAELSANIVALARMLLGGIMIWLYLFWQGGVTQLLNLGFIEWRWVIITSVLLFGYVYTFYHGLKYVPAYVAATILTLAVPITALLNLGFFRTALSLGQIIGLFIIFFSSYLLGNKYLVQERNVRQHS